MTTAWVFVYGTLLPGGSNHAVVAPYVLESKAGQLTGRLVDVGSYPACVRDEEASCNGSRVQGLWLLVELDGMAAMDKLEEFYGIEEANTYERVLQSILILSRVSRKVEKYSACGIVLSGCL